MSFTLRQLRYFLKCADLGSMTAAAQALNVATTALSLQVKALEERLGKPLFLRNSKGVELTAEGVVLAGYARRLLDLATETEIALAGAPQTVRLGVPPALARLIGIEAMVEGPHRMGGTRIELSEGWSSGLARQLVAGEIDAALVYGPPPPSVQNPIRIATETFFLATGPAAGATGSEAGHPRTLAAALGTPLVFYGSQSIAWKVTCEAARRLGLSMPPDDQVESIDLWRSLIQRGLKTSISPYGSLCNEARRGEVVLHDIADAPLRADITLLFRPGGAFGRIEESLAGFLSDLLRDAPGTIPVRAPPLGT
jgi:LysR family nitrogen assimilation transcriptional regulator